MTKPWRPAKSLISLRDQINALYPNRQKSSDGLLGDAKHSARKSEHNPNPSGVVRALDITHDPANGLDARTVADAILRSRDPRILYLISNRQIASGKDGPAPWKWRKYTGANPHTKHFHISAAASAKLYDDDSPWNLALDAAPRMPPTQYKPVAADDYPMLRLGISGSNVVRLQELLNKHGASLITDGLFGKKTEAAVKKFQKDRKLVADGVVGPYTWEELVK